MKYAAPSPPSSQMVSCANWQALPQRYTGGGGADGGDGGGGGDGGEGGDGGGPGGGGE